MRLAVASLVVALAATAALAARGATARTVPCDEIIGQARSSTSGGYREVLGVVSVPPARLIQVVPTHERPWAYWRKAGLVVRAGAPPVTVTVPSTWRRRAAITWGNRPSIVGTLTIATCAGEPDVWNAYAGGFYLRARSACVPLRFRVGEQTQVVRFGLGRRCP
jgi:hypothetical protein